MAIVNSSSYSYGTNTFGSGAFGIDVFPAVSSASVTSTSDYTRVRTGYASPTASTSTAVSNFERIREILAESNAALTFNASAAISIVASSQIQSNSTVSVNFNRVRLTRGATSLTSSVFAVGREKWEPILVVSETWTPLPLATDTWTKIAA